VRTPAHRGRPFLALAAGPLALAALALVTCTKVPTNPAAVFSLHVDSTPAPSVVAGDTLRDTLGVVRPLTAEAYNIENQVLTNVLVHFVSLSPNQLTINSANFVFGAPTGDSVASIVASADGLQSLPFTLPVVLRPDNIVYADSDSTTTQTLSLTSPDSNISAGLDILLKHIPDSVGGDSISRTYIVHYTITYPASAAAGTGTPSDTTLFAYLVDANGNPSRTDTTDINGAATRQVFFQIGRVAPNGKQDSIVAVATAMYRKTPVGGTPLRFVVHYIAPGS
jgi:hypothetical protein